MWQELIGNLAVVALAVVGWEQFTRRMEGKPVAQQNIAFALFMGAGAVASMALAVPLNDGAFLDLRASLIAISGFFGGAPAAAVSLTIAGTYRVWAGGIGMQAGLGVIVVAAMAGVAGHLLAKRRACTVWQVLFLSLAATASALIGFVFLPAPLNADALNHFAAPVLGLTFAATFISGLYILQSRHQSDERNLMQTALRQSPDFQYVKNRQSQFITVNQNVATLHGFHDPSEIRGKSDFDFFMIEHARKLFDMEQALMRSGGTLTEYEENFSNAAGVSKWYSTSKAPVVGTDGSIIGIAGVTRDITERKKIEAELLNSRNLLSYALAGMQDGLAMFDANGILLFCNEQYRTIFPLTAHVRQPGTPFRDILRAIAETGEQADIPPEETEAWIESVAATLHDHCERETCLADGRWVKFRTRPMNDGVSIVTVADTTQARQANDALLTLTAQLKSLAGTDGLTGLANRRTFDQTLLDELTRCAETGNTLSLLMIDVDRFKLYNDLYGHLAGDDCLRTIARCLQQVSNRPRQVAARYGGEEFALILPDTDQEAARLIANSVSERLATLAVPHRGNTPPHVTVSVGIAASSAHHPDTNPSDILHRADEALYAAKNGGRNRVMVWTGTNERQSNSAA